VLFDEALKIDPKDVSAHLGRAAVNITLGKYRSAVEDIDPIPKAFPDYFLAIYLRDWSLPSSRSTSKPIAHSIIGPAFSEF